MQPVEGAEDVSPQQAMPQAPSMSAVDAAFLDTLMASAPVGLAYLDAQLRFVRINQTLAAISGHTVEEHIGRVLGEIRPDSKSTFEPIVRRVIDTAQAVVDVETMRPSRDADGLPRYYLSSYNPVLDSSGRSIGVAIMVIDITERKRAEEASRQSEERYRAFVQNSSEAIWRFEIDEPIPIGLSEDEFIAHAMEGAYLAECNDATAKMYGFESAAEIVGARLIDFLSPAEPRNIEYLRAFVRSGYRLTEAESIETDVDGELKYFQNNLVGVVEDGFLWRAWGTQVDITQRRQNEIELGESELRFRQLAENTDQVFYIREARSLHFLYISPSFEAMTGRSQAELMEDPLRFLEWVHEDDRAILQQYSEPLKLQEMTVIEYRMRRPDGEVRWIHHRAFPVRDESGSIYRVAGIVQDITERRLAEEELRRERAQAQASEERFRFLAKAGEVLSASLDPDKTFESLAKLVVPRLGDWCTVDLLETDGTTRQVAQEYHQSSAALGREIQRRFPPAYQHSIGIGTVKSLRTGRAELFPDVPREMLQVMSQSPEHFELLEQLGIVSVMTVPLIVRGKVVGVISIASSESGRHFDENDLALAVELSRRAAQSMENARLHLDTQHALREAEEASRAKDDFLATVSHELRTPLTAILGWANLLQSGTIDGETTLRALQTIERNVHSQSQIIDDLLDVSRIVAGKLRLNIVPLHLGLVVQNAVDAARPAIQAKNITLELRLGEDCLVAGDATRLQQIVWNLVSNAVKFTPRDGHIKVVAERRGDHVCIAVADSGPGVSAAFAPFVFERFRQADSTATRRHGGLGLGLAIVRHLAEMHGGTVHLGPPRPSEGATFVVELPWLNTVAESTLQSPLDGAASHNGSESDSNGQSGPVLQGLRILVVEDEADGRELIVALLNRDGAQVRSASEAAEGWKLFRDLRPHVLVCDIGMPEEDGYSLMRRIRALSEEQGGQTPAIALTAYAREEDRAQALTVGFNRHLAKPVEPVALTQAVRALTGL